MPLRPDRFRELREAKALSQEALGHSAGVAHSTIAKIERGAALTTGADILERLAVALDSTIDYFFGRGFEDVNASTAATQMSFDVFSKDPKFTDEQRERCRRVLSHREAPKTSAAWRSLAEMLDLAVGPSPTTSSHEPRLALIRKVGAKPKH